MVIYQHPPVGVFIGGLQALKSLQKAPFGGSRYSLVQYRIPLIEYLLFCCWCLVVSARFHSGFISVS